MGGAGGTALFQREASRSPMGIEKMLTA